MGRKGLTRLAAVGVALLAAAPAQAADWTVVTPGLPAGSVVDAIDQNASGQTLIAWSTASAAGITTLDASGRTAMQGYARSASGATEATAALADSGAYAVAWRGLDAITTGARLDAAPVTEDHDDAYAVGVGFSPGGRLVTRIEPVPTTPAFRWSPEGGLVLAAGDDGRAIAALSQREWWHGVDGDVWRLLVEARDTSGAWHDRVASPLFRVGSSDAGGVLHMASAAVGGRLVTVISDRVDDSLQLWEVDSDVDGDSPARVVATLPIRPQASVSTLHLAVNAAGAAVLTESVNDHVLSPGPSLAFVSARDAGGAFGPPVAIPISNPTTRNDAAYARAAVSPDGTMRLALLAEDRVEARTRLPGGLWSPPQTIASGVGWSFLVVPAQARADGRLAVAFAAGDGTPRVALLGADPLPLPPAPPAPAAPVALVPAPVCAVPWLRGVSLVVAQQRLSTAGCTLGRISVVRSLAVAPGRVLYAGASAGSLFQANAAIALTVARAPHCVVPALKGLTLARARLRLHAAEWSVGAVRRVVARPALRGRVLAFAPAATRRPAAPGRVTLVVGRS